MPNIKRLTITAFILASLGIILGIASIGGAYWLVSPGSENVQSLKNIRLQVPLRIVSSDGKLIARYGTKRRRPIDIKNVPNDVKDAVLAAEDAGFYHHAGIDLKGTLRAAIQVILHGGRKVQGGSTITQQVARKFFLSSQKTYTRKIKEIFTSFRIEKILTKDQILELYLNKMFLGHRNYGIGAAAQYYYGKTVNQLTLPEAAMIASSFQSPSLVNPTDGGKRALNRRNWVLGQMLEKHFIDHSAYQKAIETPLHAFPHARPIEVHAGYLASMARQKAIDIMGEDVLTDGYTIHTTIDSARQNDAVAAVRKGLTAYDHRHGYRGPLAHIDLDKAPSEQVLDKALADYHRIADLIPGIVVSSQHDKATIYLGKNHSITLGMKAVQWAKPYISHSRFGYKPKTVDSVIKRGDIIRVKKLNADDQWELAELPAVQSGLVSLSPNDGAVQALVGGYSFAQSKFNRALMTGSSGRQPGSSFKPFIYAAALDHGFTLASTINDAPVVFKDKSLPSGRWTPSNSEGSFDGPTRLRKALFESKNLVSIRLLQATGIHFSRPYATRFGFTLKQLPNNLSLALGTASVSPMEMARANAVFANGGFLITPYFIQSITTRDHKVVYKANPYLACHQCKQRLLQDKDTPQSESTLQAFVADHAPVLEPVENTSSPADKLKQENSSRLAPRAIGQRTAYLIYSAMQSVIHSGTGRAALRLGRHDLAGKTGTTNDHRDAWFTGYNANLVTAVWVGFDNNDSLGNHEYGASAALPIWISYMGKVLKGQPEQPISKPPGITTLTINKDTGLPTQPNDPDAMQEIFKVEDVDGLRRRAEKHRHQEKQQQLLDIF